ncbi:MAG TPA: hypothetical protein VFX63_06475 [Pyrinomonadaceae bacterium]|nr:hypothetical protein [Pyrinomonadaceae bacterium]
MDEYFLRVWNDLGVRIAGPLSLRFLLQPTMATIFGIRDGFTDAKAGRPFYFHSFFTDPEHRGSRLKEGLRAVAKVFTLAVILDVLFQFIVFKWFYPVEALLVAFLLAFLPYMLVRGLVNRITRLFMHKHSQSERA